MDTKRILLVLPLMAFLCLTSACDEDKPAVRATMENIWPHADGSTWTYDMTFRSYRNALPAEVGDLPSVEELRRDLDRPLGGIPDTTITSLYTLAFEGMTTTSTGVVAQDLVQYVVGDQGPSVEAGEAVVDPRRLFPATAARDGFDPVFRLPTPLFLRGSAFAYEDSGYYAYGGWNTDHSWIYLEGGLEVGSGFSYHNTAVPGIDIWLYGQILNVGRENIGGRNYNNVVECMYIYDMGEMEVFDESGASLGTGHSYIYGVILFAPGVGPVASRERSRVIERTAYNPVGTLPTTYSVLEFECDLTEIDLPAQGPLGGLP